jgi:hypothetical protein
MHSINLQYVRATGNNEKRIMFAAKISINADLFNLIINWVTTQVSGNQVITFAQT